MYARQMREGKWELNGEPLIFGADGMLYDGHHRLRACIAAGKPFETVVIIGVKEEGLSTIDLGRSRRASDILTMRGVLSSYRIASIGRAVLIYLGDFEERRYSPVEIADMIETDRERFVWAAQVTTNFARTGLNPALMGALAFLVGPCREIEDFLYALRSGADLSEGNPALALLRMSRGRTYGRPNLSASNYRLYFTLYVKAWNAWYAKKPMSVLRVSEKEKVPAIAKPAEPKW